MSRKSHAVVSQTLIGEVLGRMTESRILWFDDADVIAGLDTLESAARALMRSMKANEHRAYQNLYHGGCPHHMAPDGSFHCSQHRQDGCTCAMWAA